MTAPAAAAGVNISTAQHHNETIYRPVRIPGVPPPSTTNPTKRTHHSKIPLNIYDMPFDKFVDHLRTIYGDVDVDLMLSGLKLIDASGCPPAVPWPDPQPIPPAAATALKKPNKHNNFSEDLDEEDLNSGDADPDLL